MKIAPAACLFFVFVLALARGGWSAEQDLIFPHTKEPLRLRLEFGIDGQTPQAIWEAFLDRWFDYLDVNADGALSADEAAQAFPFPLESRRSVTLRFSEMDVNRDNAASRAELKEFYKRAGFTPVVISIQPPTVDDVRIGRVLFEQLDRDQNGQLSPTELAMANVLLRRLDEDEDEVLTVAELLAAPLKHEASTPPTTILQSADHNNNMPHAILHFDLSGKSWQRRLSAIRSEDITLLAEVTSSETTTSPLRLRLADNFCMVAAGAEEKRKSIQSARGFYLAQMRTVLEGKSEIEKSQLEQDVGFQALVALFAPADRDRNGKLSLAELTGFLDLVEQGVLCQTVVTVRSQGRNLFYRLDQNHDNRLDLHELNAAAKLLLASKAEIELTEATVPNEYAMAIERGTPGSTFGPVALGGNARQSRSVPVYRPSGLRWFDQLDRNQDGVLSPREFLGSPELFQQVDRNTDGLISADEARQVNTSAVESK